MDIAFNEYYNVFFEKSGELMLIIELLSVYCYHEADLSGLIRQDNIIKLDHHFLGIWYQETWLQWLLLDLCFLE